MITLIMPTYKRNDFISDPDHPTLNIVKNDLVDKILLVWNNVGEKIPDNVLENLRKKCGDKLKIIISKKNSLNNKFINYPDIETECILTIDDDYVTTEASMIQMFGKWEEDKNSLVGCVPRLFCGIKSEDGSIKNVYTGDAAHLKSKVPYNFLLPGYLMFHKKYLDLYWENSDALDLIDKNISNDDVYFNLMHFKHSKSEKVYVHHDKVVKTWKHSPNSIGSRPNHHSQKYDMLEMLINQGYELPRIGNKRIDMIETGEVIK